MPALSVVVPARNAAATLAQCLCAIRNATAVSGVDAELIVSDNGSSDETISIARLHGARVIKVLDAPVAAVRNRGALQALAPLVGFVDADHEVSLGWIESALAALAEPGVAAAGAEYRAPSPATWVQRTYDALRRRSPRRCDVSWLPSGNLVVRRDAFLAVGGFDESLETCEDVDLCRRLLSGGHRVVADPALASVHHGDPATLAAVFRGEVWRGRDNLRVTLRGPRDFRSVLSALQPLATVLAVLLSLILIALEPRWTVTTALALGAFVIAASVPRALQMWFRRRPMAPAALPACVAVAIAFDLGRAVAVVVRADHGVRRKGIVRAVAQ
jgi:hypothetical protein